MNTMDVFMLVSINEKNGALLNRRSMLAYGLAGIAVHELSITGRLSFEGKVVTLKSSSHTGDLLLDEVIDFMEKRHKSCKVTALVTRLSFKVNRIAKRTLERLEDNGNIKIEQNRFLGLIPYNRYIISRVNEHEKLVNEIKEIIRNGDKRPEVRQALLISVLCACSVLHRLFDREERKQYRETFRRIGKATYFETLDEFGAEVHKAVKAAITAANAAAT